MKKILFTLVLTLIMFSSSIFANGLEYEHREGGLRRDNGTATRSFIVDTTVAAHTTKIVDLPVILPSNVKSWQQVKAGLWANDSAKLISARIMVLKVEDADELVVANNRVVSGLSEPLQPLFWTSISFRGDASSTLETLLNPIHRSTGAVVRFIFMNVGTTASDAHGRLVLIGNEINPSHDHD
jgi:hypothetical protein